MDKRQNTGEDFAEGKYSEGAEKERQKFIMTEDGALVDSQGQAIKFEAPRELMVNKKNKRKQELDFQELFKRQKHDRTQMLKSKDFFDSSIQAQSSSALKKRKVLGLSFIKPGVYKKKEELLTIKKDEGEVAAGEELEDLDDFKDYKEPEEIKVGKQSGVKPLDPIPDIEWWDQFFLPPGQHSFPQENLQNENLHMDKITHFIQHPVALKNKAYEKVQAVEVPKYLTEQEKKKVKHISRVEKSRDFQEKVKFGLIPAPKPKVTLSNYMHIRGKDLALDPSKVEKEVRREIAQRVLDHEKRNEENKLTSFEKEAKMKRKHERDAERDLRECLFKIRSLEKGKHRFKIDMNAKQLHLTGCCLVPDYSFLQGNQPCLVVAEGGKRAIKKYKALLLRRIHWFGEQQKKEEKEVEEEDALEENDDHLLTESRDGGCFLVWEGDVTERNFRDWRMQTFRSDKEAKKILQQRNCESYWNSVANFKMSRAIGDEPVLKEHLLK